MTDKGTVLVTGASGYIAGYVVRALLADGWAVRGTIRDVAKAGRARAALGLSEAELPFVAADLSSDAGWAEAAAGCTHVQHVASPFPPGAPKHEDDLIVPARDGALRVLRAARDSGVRRVVMTSSVAAIAYGHDPGRPFTEADWTDPASPDAYPYARSKTIAERAARDWVAAEGAGLELVTINPGLVLGPVTSADLSASHAIVTKLLDGALPGLPRFGFAIVDVRDVAAAHVAAMTAPGMAGERFIAAGPFMWMSDIAAVLKSRLGDRAKRVPTMTLPDFAVRLSALFDKEVKAVITELGRARPVDNRHIRDRLGWSPRAAEETIVDTARSLIERGLVRR